MCGVGWDGERKKKGVNILIWLRETKTQSKDLSRRHICFLLGLTTSGSKQSRPGHPKTLITSYSTIFNCGFLSWSIASASTSTTITTLWTQGRMKRRKGTEAPFGYVLEVAHGVFISIDQNLVTYTLLKGRLGNLLFIFALMYSAKHHGSYHQRGSREEIWEDM